MDIRDSSSSLPQPAFDGEAPPKRRRQAARSRRDASASSVARPTRSSLQRALGGKDVADYDDESLIDSPKKSSAKRRSRKKSAAQLQEEALDASAVSVLDATHFNGNAVSSKKIRSPLAKDFLNDESIADLSEADLKIPAYLRKKGKNSLHDEVLEERFVDKKPKRTRKKAKVEPDDSALLDESDVKMPNPTNEAKTKAPKRRKKRAAANSDVPAEKEKIAHKKRSARKEKSKIHQKKSHQKKSKKKPLDESGETLGGFAQAEPLHSKKNTTQKLAKHVRFSALPMELIGLSTIAAGILLSLSLISFTSTDVISLAQKTAQIKNWIGPIGAWTSGLLVTLLGMGAFASPLVIFAIGTACFRRRVLRPRWHQAAGLLLTAIGTATLLDVVFAGSEKVTFAAGGLLGAALAKFLIGGLAPLGTGILAALATGTGLLLAVDRSLSKVVHDTSLFMHEIISVIREMVGLQLEKARLLDEERDELEEEAQEERARKKAARAAEEQMRNERIQNRAKKVIKEDVMAKLDEKSRVLRLPTPGVLDVDLSHATQPRQSRKRNVKTLMREPKWQHGEVNTTHLDASMPRILRPKTHISNTEALTSKILATEVLPSSPAADIKLTKNAHANLKNATDASAFTSMPKIHLPPKSSLSDAPAVAAIKSQPTLSPSTQAQKPTTPHTAPVQEQASVAVAEPIQALTSNQKQPPALPKDASSDDIVIKTKIEDLDDTLVSPISTPAKNSEPQNNSTAKATSTSPLSEAENRAIETALKNDAAPDSNSKMPIATKAISALNAAKQKPATQAPIQLPPQKNIPASPPEQAVDAPKNTNDATSTQMLIKNRVEQDVLEEAPAEEETYTRYEMPPLSLLNYDAPERPPLDSEKMRRQADKLVQTFGNFGIEGKVREIRPGPIVTTYEFVPAPGIKISKIASLSDDLAMAMAAIHVRIVAPIPGKGAIGIEVPNAERETVYLKEIIGDKNFLQDGDSKLKMAMGKDIEGKTYFADLGGMPHVLISGTTGSGKSVAVNGMIASLLYRATPEEVKFLMIDPKMLELSIYDGIPHLLLPPIIDTSKAANALRWTVEEMDRRYHAMSNLGVRDIKGYNEIIEQIRTKKHPTHSKMPVDDRGKAYKKAPYIVVIIDEYADLLSTAGKDVEMYVMRLAQKARAAGIHVMLATQRPSVDVITGVIKANFPVRMGFRLASTHDSKTIINRPGAEKLLGRGDMLMMPAGTSDVTRVHGAFVSEVELHRVVEHWKGQGKPKYDMSIIAPPADEVGPSDESGDAPLDARWDDAIAIVARSRRCSTSWLQRQLGVGYNRAARIVERLEKEKLVGPQLNSKGDRDINIPPLD